MTTQGTTPNIWSPFQSLFLQALSQKMAFSNEKYQAIFLESFFGRACIESGVDYVVRGGSYFAEIAIMLRIIKGTIGYERARKLFFADESSSIERYSAASLVVQLASPLSSDLIREFIQNEESAIASHGMRLLEELVWSSSVEFPLAQEVLWYPYKIEDADILERLNGLRDDFLPSWGFRSSLRPPHCFPNDAYRLPESVDRETPNFDADVRAKGILSIGPVDWDELVPEADPDKIFTGKDGYRLMETLVGEVRLRDAVDCWIQCNEGKECARLLVHLLDSDCARAYTSSIAVNRSSSPTEVQRAFTLLAYLPNHTNLEPLAIGLSMESETLVLSAMFALKSLLVNEQCSREEALKLLKRARRHPSATVKANVSNFERWTRALPEPES